MTAHHCHAIDCKMPVSPTMLMCRQHWQMAPTKLRFAVIEAYRKGQCTDKNPSRNWLFAARCVINFVAIKEGKMTKEQHESWVNMHRKKVQP